MIVYIVTYYHKGYFTLIEKGETITILLFVCGKSFVNMHTILQHISYDI